MHSKIVMAIVSLIRKHGACEETHVKSLLSEALNELSGVISTILSFRLFTLSYVRLVGFLSSSLSLLLSLGICYILVYHIN